MRALASLGDSPASRSAQKSTDNPPIAVATLNAPNDRPTTRTTVEYVSLRAAVELGHRLIGRDEAGVRRRPHPPRTARSQPGWASRRRVSQVRRSAPPCRSAVRPPAVAATPRSTLTSSRLRSGLIVSGRRRARSPDGGSRGRARPSRSARRRTPRRSAATMRAEQRWLDRSLVGTRALDPSRGRHVELGRRCGPVGELPRDDLPSGQRHWRVCSAPATSSVSPPGAGSIAGATDTYTRAARRRAGRTRRPPAGPVARGPDAPTRPDPACSGPIRPSGDSSPSG